MRIRRSTLVLVSLLTPYVFATHAHAQGPYCTQSYVTVSNAAGVALFQVAATVVVPSPSDQTYKLYYAGDFQNTPTAVFRTDAGLTLKQPTNPAANCNLPDSSDDHLFSWMALENGIAFATVQANAVQAFPTTSPINPGNLVFYNTPLQPNAVLSMPLIAPLPVAVVREDSYCPANVNCGTPSPQQQHQPSPATSPGTNPCATILPYGYPVLTGKNIFFHKKRYRAHLELWPPIDNGNECGVRQLLFNVPQDLVDGLGIAGDKDQPRVKIVITGPAGKPAMTIYAISRQPNGSGYVLYAVNSQSPQDVQVNGDYFADITITGRRTP